MDISLAGEIALLAGTAILLVLCATTSRVRRQLSRKRRAKPAHPGAPHTSTMWANQHVSAAATRATAKSDHSLSLGDQNTADRQIPDSHTVPKGSR